MCVCIVFFSNAIIRAVAAEASMVVNVAKCREREGEVVRCPFGLARFCFITVLFTLTIMNRTVCRLLRRFRLCVLFETGVSTN